VTAGCLLQVAAVVDVEGDRRTHLLEPVWTVTIS